MASAHLFSLRAAFSLIDELPYCDGSLQDVYDKEPSFAKLFYNVGEQSACINFADDLTENQLKGLADACHKATFGLNDKDVLDEGYHKAGKMDTTEFATLLSPNALDLLNVVATNLLRGKKSANDIEAKLYKLNVYGPGSFFKPHVDTPRGDQMFGTLVLVLPTQHEGGALAFNHSGQQWTFDSAKALADKPKSIAYVAFLGDMQHEVLPVISGYRVTLTYNLHYREEVSVPANVVSMCDYPGLEEMRHSLSALLKDHEFLPNGGLMGFGLSHRYPFDVNRGELTKVYDNLRGADALLGDLCKELGIDFSLKVLYHNDDEPDFCLLDSFVSRYNIETKIEDPVMGVLVRKYDATYCRDIDRVRRNIEADIDSDCSDIDAEDQTYYSYTDGDETFTPLVWIKPLSKSNTLENIDAVYGNESSWSTLYGELCLVATVAPTAERFSSSGKRGRSESTSKVDNLAKKAKTTKYSSEDEDSLSDEDSD